MTIWKKNKNKKSFTLPNFSKERLRNFQTRDFLKKNLGGFTLIELLVVIVVIGILTTTIFVNLSRARAKGRDTKRLQDMHEIIAALQLYWSDHGGYPDVTCPCSTIGGQNWETSNETSTPNSWLEFLASYMGQKIPADPLNNQDSFYAFTKYDVSPTFCPEIKFPYVIVTASHLETVPASDLPEAKCSNYDWSANFDYSVMLIE